MISTQEQDSPKLRSRYRPLAGPFYEQQSGLCEALLASLVTGKARVIIASERGGVTIFRLRSECETLQETERRLGKLKHR